MRLPLVTVCLAALLLSPAFAADPAKERIKAAEAEIDAALGLLAKARKEKAEPPVDALLRAMTGLAKIGTRRSVLALGKRLAHRDLLVSRCAVLALREVPESHALLAGKLAAARLEPRAYKPERRYLFVDLIETVAGSGYLGGAKALVKCLNQIGDGEVHLAVATAFVTLKDLRGADPLFDWVNWNKGGQVEGNPMHERKTADPHGPRGKNENEQMNTGVQNQGNSRSVGTGGVECEPPSSKEVLDRVWRLLFELLGRDFESWEEICRYFVDERGNLKKKSAEIGRRLAEQEKAIRALE